MSEVLKENAEKLRVRKRTQGKERGLRRHNKDSTGEAGNSRKDVYLLGLWKEQHNLGEKKE